VFTVTGKWVLSITALVNQIIKSTSFKTPAPLQTTFFTGQPKLYQLYPDFTVETILNKAIASSSPPKSGFPQVARNQKYLTSFGF
jgi:hypothetical protein